MQDLLFVGHSGYTPEPQQVIAARYAACFYLQEGLEGKHRFDIRGCDGTLRHIRTAPWGGTSGDFFSADFGGGQVLDFFIPRGTENIPMDTVMLRIRPRQFGDTGFPKAPRQSRTKKMPSEHEIKRPNADGSRMTH